MKARYLFFLLLLPVCAKAQTGWQYIGPDTLDVMAVYGQRDSLVVITYLEAPDGMSYELKAWTTTNAGTTWNEILNTKYFYLRSRFVVPDPSHFERLYAIKNSNALRSTDFGNTWQVVQCKCGGNVSSGNSMFYPAPYDTNTIFIRTYMGFAEPVHIMNRSTDGGNTWEDISIGGTSSHGRELHLAPWDGGPVLYLYFQDRMSRENLYVSTNGGREWQIIGTPSINLMFIQTSHWDDQELYSYSPALHQSQDGGFSFRGLNPIQLNFGEKNVTQDVGFFISRIDRDRLYVASQDSGVYRSADKGYNWMKIDEMKMLPRSPQGYIHNPSSNRVGLYIHEITSKIYVGTGKGVYMITNPLTDVKIQSQYDKFITTFSCYPNPFQSYLTVRYILSSPSSVQIEITDSFGRRVKTILNEHQDSGEYVLDIQRSTLPPGVYLVRASIGERLYLKKIILMN